MSGKAGINAGKLVTSFLTARPVCNDLLYIKYYILLLGKQYFLHKFRFLDHHTEF